MALQAAGRKVVSWDVGFGFRPNDLVQQEARRASLLPSALQGRPLLGTAPQAQQVLTAKNDIYIVVLEGLPQRMAQMGGARAKKRRARWRERRRDLPPCPA
mgnify:CR=1 FL=1